MTKHFLIFIGITFILFILGSTIGENRGTPDSIFYWPIVLFILGGLLYFGFLGIKGLINKNKK